nr:retrovirus-related Pol polyprotein from transposon TNT 1-94 [Tanacetum cinerariifolium]
MVESSLQTACESNRPHDEKLAPFASFLVEIPVLVTKPHNKTPYELLLCRSPSIGFMRPFGCLVTILNTLDPLEKFDGKVDKRFLVGYSVNRKAFRVFKSRTMIVQETLHITFLENKPNVTGIGPKWRFDIDTLTMSMNYQPVVTGNQPNDNVGIKENLDADPQNIDDDVADAAFDVNENDNDVRVSTNGSDKSNNKKHDENAKKMIKERVLHTELEDIIYSDDEEDVGAEADLSNLETHIFVGLILTTRVHKDHLVNQIIGALNSAPQTRSMTRMVKEQGGLHQINDEDFHTWLQVKQKDNGIFISQDKYVAKILRKFDFIDIKSASTPIETEKPLLKDPNGEDVDVHIY